MVVQNSMAQKNMVQCQLMPNRIHHLGILHAFETVRREDFLPNALQALAYVDEEVPLGQGRFLLEPRLLAWLVQSANPQSGQTALIVAAGSGYSANILAKLDIASWAWEPNAMMQSESNSLIHWIQEPFLPHPLADAPKTVDFIIIDHGSIETIPPDFFQYLVGMIREGGYLMYIHRTHEALGVALCHQKQHNQMHVMHSIDAFAPVLPEFAQQPRFVF
jgi:protein-L-isoaspartate(D-aspartate) O-methyltransferase